MPFAKLLSAASFAADKHRYHRRKDKEETPYINHPIDVAKVIATIGNVNDTDILIAAVLHDTVEDTDTTPEEIEAQFGARVRELVDEVTDDKSLSKSARKQAQIEHASHLSKDAAIIKLADKLCNCRDIIERPPAWEHERKLAYFEWARQVIEQLPQTNEALFNACHAMIDQGIAHYCD